MNINEFVSDKRTGEMTAQSKHSVVSKARGSVAVTGVTDVKSFDDRSVLLATDCGNMLIEGEDLHISVLNIENGIVEAEGKINGLIYYESQKSGKKGLREKLFG